MRDIISFESPVSVQDENGFVRNSWETVLTCKAYRKKTVAAPGDEMNASEVFIDTTVTFQTYRYPTIKDDQRVVWEGRRYRIILIDPQQFDNTYVITCKKENE